MSHIIWEDWFYCDASSPSGLRAKVDRYGGCGALQVRAGSVAGHKTTGKNGKKGYWCISITINGEHYQTQAHRIIWQLTYKEVPDTIDHIDGDRTNNAVENLRNVTVAVNCRNRTSSGVVKPYDAPTGVYRTEQVSYRKTFVYWIAGWNDVDGKKRLQRFSVFQMGEEGAYAAAVAFRQAKMQEIKDVLGYSERHLRT
jgi:hypothetical protein